MKKLSLLMLLSFAFAGNVYAQKFGTPGMWTSTTYDGEYWVQTAVNKNTSLSFVCNGGSSEMSIRVNGKIYEYDDDQFELFINGKKSEDLRSLKTAKKIEAVYGKGKRITFPTKNAQKVLDKCFKFSY